MRAILVLLVVVPWSYSSAQVAACSGGPLVSIAAAPNPIQVAAGVSLGETTISWNAPCATALEIRVGSVAGTLFAAGGSVGSAQTGNWVSNGMTFVLVDVATNVVVATTTVSLTTGAANAIITASPNPIPVGAGLAAGPTTISWNAPGFSPVEVHVGSAAGPLFAAGSAVGYQQTGNWVVNGMNFVLVDGATRATLAATTVALAKSGHSVTLSWIPSISANVSGYNVYRTVVDGAPYAKLTPLPIGDLEFVDDDVASGQIYFYVVTAVDINSLESDYSNVAAASVPAP